MASEKKLDNKVLAYIESIGGWSIKYWAGAKFTKSGVPDVLACIDGYFFGIEDKALNGKPTLLQLKNLEWIRKSGGYGILLYPDDFDNFKNFINEEWEFDPRNMSIEQKQWYDDNIKLQYYWQAKLENF